MQRDAVTDSEAIERSVADPDVFVAVFERHFDAVARFLGHRVGADAADELTGETFARAFRQRAKYRPDGPSALPWLYGIANWVVSEHRRAERRRLRVLAKLASQAGGGTSPEPELRGVSPELVRSLRRLPAGERDALLLVAWGDLTYEQAAEALHVPVGTVRSRIARARKRLGGSPNSDLPSAMPGGAHA